MKQPHTRSWGALLALLLLGFNLSGAAAATVVFRRIYDVTRPPPGVSIRPDQQILIPGGSTNAPAFDGRYVVFATFVGGGAPNPSQLWAYDTSNGAMLRLADTDTSYPGTAALLRGYDSTAGFAPFVVDDGIVAFSANANDGIGDTFGFLSRAARNGSLLSLVDTTTPTPDGSGPNGNFSRFTFQSMIGLDIGTFVFNQDKTQGDGGAYSVPVNGGSVTELADDIFMGTLFAPECCEASDFSNGVIVADTSNVFGTGPIVIREGTTTLKTIVSAERGDKVPGDPDDRAFDNFRLHSPQIEQANVVFHGAAIRKDGSLDFDLAGLYSFIADDSLPRASTGDGLPPYASGSIRRLVDSNRPVPGGTGQFVRDDPFSGTLAGGAYSASGRQVFFLGRDEAGIDALFHVPIGGGTITRIVGNGDRLPDGRKVVGSSGHISNQPAIQIASARGDQIAVRLTVQDDAIGPDAFDAIYLLSSRSLPAQKLSCFGRAPTIIGTAGKNRINGTPRQDVIMGLGGDDTIRGLGGNDLICGGSGNDRLFGDKGNDKLNGGTGTDRCASGGRNLRCETIAN